MLETVSRARDAQDACRQLVELALGHLGRDNMIVLVREHLDVDRIVTDWEALFGEILA